MAMGYTREKASRALAVTEGDLEQAVGYLLLGDSDAFQGVASGEGTFGLSEDTVTTPLDNDVKPGAYRMNKDDLCVVIMDMGYSRGAAMEALEASGGNLDGAVDFLLSGGSHLQLAVRRSNSVTINNDAAMAALLQEEEMKAAKGALTARSPIVPEPVPDSTMYHATSVRNEVDAPRMVLSTSFLNTEGAGPFCACAAARDFLGGGIMTADFLDDILQYGTELFRKSHGVDMNVAQVLEKYGSSHLNLEADTTGGWPKEGVYRKDHLNDPMGLRKLLAACRNEQPAGWRVLILEVGPLENICLALPPKGSTNKFWYIDCYPRPCFRATGAHARVHTTLLQLGESLEKLLDGLMSTTKGNHETFRIHVIKKV